MNMEKINQNQENNLSQEWYKEFDEITKRIKKNISGKVGVDSVDYYSYIDEDSSPEKDHNRLIELSSELHKKRETLLEYDILNNAIDGLIFELTQEFDTSPNKNKNNFDLDSEK